MAFASPFVKGNCGLKPSGVMPSAMSVSTFPLSADPGAIGTKEKDKIGKAALQSKAVPASNWFPLMKQYACAFPQAFETNMNAFHARNLNYACATNIPTPEDFKS